jgi:ribokinase
MTDTGCVASFGSVNLDRVCRVEAAPLETLAARFDWFPAAGETRPVASVPADLDEYVTTTLPGGKGANQAVAAANAGATTAFFGKVGTTTAPLDPLAELAAHGVDTDGVGTAPGPTGTAYVFVGPDGENHIALLAGANAAVDPAYAREQLSAIMTADVLLVQNEVPTAATETLLAGLADCPARPTVVLDPSPADGVAPLLSAEAVDVVTPNEGEAAALGAALEAFDGVVCYKHGPDPVEVVTPDRQFTVAPPAADPVDTTGAGDVFAGYLGAALARDTGLREAVHLGCAAAAYSTEHQGVQRATPDRETVLAWRDASSDGSSG